jgi:hypothetical protein
MMGGDLAIDSLVSSKISAKQAKLDAKDAGKQAKLDAKEAGKQAKLDAKEAAKQAKLDAKEAAKQAKLDAKEAAKQAKVLEKEAAKQAKLLAKEAAKQAKLHEKEAANQAKLHDRDDQKRPNIDDKDDPPRQESSTRDGQLHGQEKIPDISNKDLKFLVFAFYIMGKSVHANKNFDVDQFVQINLLNDEQKFSDMLQQFFKNFNSIFQQFSLFKKNNFIHFHLLADIAFSNQQNIDIDVKLHIVNGKKVLIDKNNIVYHFERHTPIGFWQNNNIVYVE